MKTLPFTRWPADVRASALFTFRHYRSVLGARQAYWLSLFRYGWPAVSEYAWRRLNTMGRMASRMP